jgi:hypothetical protein
MTTTIDLICHRCKHWAPITGCVAFPDGIPDEILVTNKHNKPLPKQTDDLIFEPKKSSEDARN